MQAVVSKVHDTLLLWINAANLGQEHDQYKSRTEPEKVQNRAATIIDNS